MIFLLVSLLALASGPLLYRVADRAGVTLAGLDGFVMVSVAGLALTDIIPHAVAVAGPLALAVALLGFFGPGLVEHQLERAARHAHAATLAVAAAGLVVHEFFDGVGLATPVDGDVLAVAVVLHRVPIAITIWWLLVPSSGRRVATAVLVALGAATIAGYALGGAVAHLVDATWVSLVSALIAGSLLHVVVHRPTPIAAPGGHRREQAVAGAGALVGLAVVAWLAGGHPDHVHGEVGAGAAFAALALTAAPFLTVGLGLAALQPARAELLALDALLLAFALFGASFTAALALGLAAVLAVSPREARALPATAADLLDRAVPRVLLGLALAGLAAALLADRQLVALPAGLGVAVVALLGLPLRLPAAALAPLALALVHHGVSPGAALALLITGPSGGLGRLARQRGVARALVTGAATAAIAVAVGLAFDLLAPTLDLAGLAREGAAPLERVCLAALALAAGWSLLRQGPRGFVAQVMSSPPAGAHNHDHARRAHHDHAHGGEPPAGRSA